MYVQNRHIRVVKKYHMCDYQKEHIYVQNTYIYVVSVCQHN